MNIVAIVQARMASSRLPNKSGMPITGKPLIWHVLHRVRQAKLVTRVVLTVPAEAGNEVLIRAAADLRVIAIEWAADPNDLIGRYTHAAWSCDADVIVRVPGDNPCVDPDEIDRIIKYHMDSEWKWLTSNLDQNILGNGYPGGLGAEVWSRSFLEWLDKTTFFPMLREHPHLTAYANNVVSTCECPDEFAYPAFRFDVNTLADFQRIDSLYLRLSENFRSKELVTVAKESALDIAA
jgi:spore coat polysaccharide biosynthesis protein SpsF (cytidylyltransferase family)